MTTDSECSPLDRLPKEVSAALVAAGWRPGVPRRRISTSGVSRLLRHVRRAMMSRDWRSRHEYGTGAPFGEFGAASKVRNELDRLKIEPLMRLGPLMPLNVAFTLEHLHKNHDDDIRVLGELLKVRLCAIGNAGRWMSILLLADSGHVMELGFEEAGVYLMGTNLGDALRRILTGECGVPVEFSAEQDPDGRFRRERSPADEVCPNRVALRPSALQGIHGLEPYFPDEDR